MIFKEDDFPARCGVYIFKDINGSPLYIGKAKDIRKRLKSHFKENGFKKIKLIDQTEKIDFIITPDELSALFLENNLIKKHQPKYNVNLKDDKTYPFIEITIQDRYPKILYTRKIKEGSLYFGPFYPAQKAKKIISFIQKSFGIAVCKRDLNRTYTKPCLYFYLKKCLGPCVPGLTNKNKYNRKVLQAVLFIKGKNKKLLKEIKKEIEDNSKKLRFEEAKNLKEIYNSIEEIKERIKIYRSKIKNTDVFGIYGEGKKLCLAVLNFKNDNLFGKKTYLFEELETEDLSFFLSQILPQYYISNPIIPEKIILPLPVNEEIFIDFLKKTKGKKVIIKVPEKGKDKNFLQVAEENAKEYFYHRIPLGGIENLKKILNLEKLYSIAGVDISHFQGRNRYGGIVFFENGKFEKKKYRSFKLKTYNPRDDPSGIYEIVKRYLSRLLSEEKKIPDLILIDGGKTQLSSALKAKKETGAFITIISIEKGEEKIFIEAKKKPIILEKNSPALLLLMKIRDEAHRFVITLHRKISNKKFLKS